MAEAQATFSESWYRVANQRLCLRPSVKVRRQNFRGERWFVLENPFTNEFFRLRPAAYEFLARLEAAIDRYNGPLAPLKEFILPGGSRAAALAHLARAVCRRAERAVVALAQAEPVSTAARQYLNRLSDLLFVLGRHLNIAAGGSDVLWQKGKNA
jgi:cob(I)alamin adenosyltransferase